MTDYRKETEEIKIALESFYRRSRQERNRRQNAFGFHFDSEENRRFSEEMTFLKPVETAFYHALDQFLFQENEGFLEKEIIAKFSMVPLEEEITSFSDLEAGQILWYLWRKKVIFSGNGAASDLHVFETYLLEVANLAGGIGPEEAMKEMFSTLQKGMDAGLERIHLEDYYLKICQSFLIANPQMVRAMQEALMACDLYWRWDLSECVLNGQFLHADDFIKRHAKGLKEEEVTAKKDYQKAAWSALPAVMSSLNQTFSREGMEGKCFFQTIVTMGKESKEELDLLPVCRSRMGQKRRVILSNTAAFDYKMTYGKRAEECWLLSQAEFCDGTREFLTLIYRYTESFMREYCGVAKRKRSPERFLKKKYVRSGDHPRTIRFMKKVLEDSRFESAILQGVKEYLKENPFAVKKEKKETAKEKAQRKLYAMDHEEIERKNTLNLEEFRKLRKEADHMMTLFQDGTIDYET